MAFFECLNLDTINSSVGLSEIIDNNIEELFSFRRLSHNEIIKSSDIVERLILLKHRYLEQLDYESSNYRYFILMLLDICERLNLREPIPILYRIITENGIAINSRMEAGLTFVYPKPSDADEMVSKMPFICDKLQYAIQNEEDTSSDSIITFLYYYTAVIDSLHVTKANEVRNLFLEYLENDSFPFLSQISEIATYDVACNETIAKIEKYIDKITNNLYASNISNSEDSFLIEEDTDYSDTINSISSITFDKIREISVNNSGKNLLKNRGVEIIDNEEDLYTYLKSYGPMHKAKVLSAIDEPFPQYFDQPVTVIDWGCGQGLASFVLMEKLGTENIRQVILIEPSELALRRAALHCKAINPNANIITIQKKLDSLEVNDFRRIKYSNVINLFSNILDIDDYSVNHLTSLLEKIKKSNNYYVCVSPHIDELKTAKINMFHNYFKDSKGYECIHEESNTKNNKYWLCNNVYKSKLLKHGAFDCGLYITSNDCEKKWTRELRVFKA